MKVLLVGTGQLSFEFQKYFSKNDIDFLLTSSSGKPNTIRLDISDFSNVLEVFKTYSFDVVINCGAYNQVDSAEKEWEKAFSVNGLGPRNLAIMCEERNIPLVHFSTDYVFDGNKTEPYTIADPPNPISKYGLSKLLGENLVKEISGKHIIARVSWVFGVGNDTNFAKKVISWSQNDVIRVSTDEVSVPTYAKDIVVAVMKLLEMRAYGLYHVTNEGICSRYEYAKFILEKIGYKGKLIEAKQSDFNLPAKRPHFSKLDNFGLRETANVEMPHWQKGVEEFLREVGVIV